jgi:hypothetical protein
MNMEARQQIRDHEPDDHMDRWARAHRLYEHLVILGLPLLRHRKFLFPLELSEASPGPHSLISISQITCSSAGPRGPAVKMLGWRRPAIRLHSQTASL